MPFPILKLPAELRLCIYEYALIRDNELRQIAPDDTITIADISLLATSRQIYVEALPVFYNWNIFRVRIFDDFHRLPSWTIDIHPKHMAFIRNVHVGISNFGRRESSANQQPVASLAQLLKFCERLSFVKLTITYDLPQGEDFHGEPEFKDIVAAFKDVAEVKEVIVRHDERVGLRYKIRQAKAELEETRRSLKLDGASILSSCIETNSIIGPLS